jgi:hypothetical protein
MGEIAEALNERLMTQSQAITEQHFTKLFF